MSGSATLQTQTDVYGELQSIPCPSGYNGTTIWTCPQSGAWALAYGSCVGIGRLTTKKKNFFFCPFFVASLFVISLPIYWLLIN
jgi:hypothetical protein